MRSQRLWWMTLSLMAFGATLYAADISGRWEGEYTTYDGAPGQSTFVFKQDGARLTGTVNTAGGDFEIREGVVKDDQVSFFVNSNAGGRKISLTYTGVVADGEIRFKVAFPGAVRGMEVRAKKTS